MRTFQSLGLDLAVGSPLLGPGVQEAPAGCPTHPWCLEVVLTRPSSSSSQDPSPPLPLVCLWVRWGSQGEGCGHVQAFGLQLQGHSQPPAPDLAIQSVSRCCGRGLWGASQVWVASAWGPRFPADGVTGHAHRIGVLFSHVHSPVFAQGAD